METQRLILWLVFSFGGLMLWQQWEREHMPAPLPAATTSRSTTREAPAAAPANGAAAPTTTAGTPPSGASQPTGKTIEIRTDLYKADVDTVGGTITQVALEMHRAAEDTSKPYLLLQHYADRTFVAQAGLI